MTHIDVLQLCVYYLSPTPFQKWDHICNCKPHLFRRIGFGGRDLNLTAEINNQRKRKQRLNFKT